MVIDVATTNAYEPKRIASSYEWFLTNVPLEGRATCSAVENQRFLESNAEASNCRNTAAWEEQKQTVRSAIPNDGECDCLHACRAVENVLADFAIELENTIRWTKGAFHVSSTYLFSILDAEIPGADAESDDPYGINKTGTTRVRLPFGVSRSITAGRGSRNEIEHFGDLKQQQPAEAMLANQGLAVACALTGLSRRRSICSRISNVITPIKSKQRAASLSTKHKAGKRHRERPSKLASVIEGIRAAVQVSFTSQPTAVERQN